jgi:hypothetical protein
MNKRNLVMIQILRKLLEDIMILKMRRINSWRHWLKFKTIEYRLKILKRRRSRLRRKDLLRRNSRKSKLRGEKSC